MNEPPGAGGTRANIALVLFVVLAWGINWPIMKIGVAAFGPLPFVAIRMALATLTMTLIAAVAGGLRWPARHDMPAILNAGVLQMAAYLLLVGFALRMVDASRAALLVYTTPIWVAPFSRLLLKEPVEARQVAGVLLALAGVAVLLNPFALDWSDRTAVTGNLLLLLAAMIWSAGMIHVRAHHWTMTTLEALPWQLGAGSLFVLLVLAIARPPLHMAWAPSALAAAGFNGVIATALGFLAWNKVTREMPILVTATASLGIPAVGMIGSTWLLGESIDFVMAAGAALILAGLGISLTRARR